VPTDKLNDRTIVGAPDVVLVYAKDARGKTTRKFVDKYVHFSFVSIEGCNFDIKYASRKKRTESNLS
jgi:hypothetical protein